MPSAGPINSKVNFLINTPELSPETEKTLKVLENSTSKAFTSIVKTPIAARTISKTLFELQKSKATQEQNKIFNYLRMAGAIALLILAGAVILGGLLAVPLSGIFLGTIIYGILVTLGVTPILATFTFISGIRIYEKLSEEQDFLENLQKLANTQKEILGKASENPQDYIDAANICIANLERALEGKKRKFLISQPEDQLEPPEIQLLIEARQKAKILAYEKAIEELRAVIEYFETMQSDPKVS